MKNLNITNPNKILFPKDNITKFEIINYYLEISKHIMPFLKNRLISVIRCHKDIEHECFFKKHPTTEREYVESFFVGQEEYFYIKNEVQLVQQVQFGTLEFHTWAGNVKNMKSPDMMIFDLDPDEKLPLKNLREAVMKIKTILDELDLESFLKTSGGKGYHIMVPFSAKKSWEEFYDFSKNVAMLAEQKWPKIFTTNIRKEDRKGKIFIDYLRNNKGSTCIAPFSTRARSHAPISMPISWSCLDKISPNQITIKNYNSYLSSMPVKLFDLI